MIRETCGTVRGARAHVAASEGMCGWCAQAELAARMEAERMRRLPPLENPALPFTPLLSLTAQQAKDNAALLDREVAAAERDHGADRRRALRVVPPAA